MDARGGGTTMGTTGSRGGAPAMIRSLLVLHARAGRRDDLLRMLEVLELRALVEGRHGFLEVEVATAADDQDEVVIVGSWSSRELYERWLAGPEPDRLLRAVRGLLTADPVSRVYHVVESVS
jgi:heme-degrading monooxygenase HmoA